MNSKIIQLVPLRGHGESYLALHEDGSLSAVYILSDRIAEIRALGFRTLSASPPDGER